MLRTQIYIPEQLHQRAKILAEKKQQSLADLLRVFIERGLREEQQKQGKTGLSNIVKLEISGGPKDLSSNLDSYIYGGK